ADIEKRVFTGFPDGGAIFYNLHAHGESWFYTLVLNMQIPGLTVNLPGQVIGIQPRAINPSSPQ
ncbi:hypothetical protein OFN40_31900, partial [Escherichia coli]|nr:hypothetical protein [Escherichia coli]